MKEFLATGTKSVGVLLSQDIQTTPLCPICYICLHENSENFFANSIDGWMPSTCRYEGNVSEMWKVFCLVAWELDIHDCQIYWEMMQRTRVRVRLCGWLGATNIYVCDRVILIKKSNMCRKPQLPGRIWWITVIFCTWRWVSKWGKESSCKLPCTAARPSPLLIKH